ncbi:hypothetical protein [Kitasatospora sp. NPDC094011]|uniref:hypothetical protein n=1 Tax=Kitasatospora sp. NPDC094011 TaxID=3364090 RepID=UPI0037FCFB53
MKRHVLTHAATLTGAVLLTLTAPALAHASTGLFTFETPGGVQEQLINPTDNTCYNIDAYGPYRNGTNRHAVFYPGTKCRGNETIVDEGAGSSLLNAQSVKFVR